MERAGRYLRKFYPWYADAGLTKRERHALVTAPTTADAREAWSGFAGRRNAACGLTKTAISAYGVLLHCSIPPDRTNGGFPMARETVLTPKGLEELKAKIEHLPTDRRREVAERIKEAREFGDISENAEYDDAKNEQAMLEKQIADLEDKLRCAR